MESPSGSVVEELSVSECWALLRDVPIGRIALQNDGEIEIFPVNYVIDGGTVLFRSAHGTKLNLIGAGAPCTFEADELDVSARVVWSIVLKGSAQPVRGHDAIIATFGADVLTWQAGSKPTYVRITPHSITGRRFPVIPAQD